jgi:AcrR family transcriptional regulator
MAKTRADAVRNQAALLQAAEELVERDGAAGLRIAEVAKRAGVGPGTVYRAFGSKSELLLALLSERERVLQEEVLRGEPPLGPGAPAAERLVAFVGALHELVVRERKVLMAAEEGDVLGRHNSAVHAGWRLHVTHLLKEARPDADADVLAELLLAAVAAGLNVHLIDERKIPAKRVRAEILRLVESVLRG